jgi:ABC-2 type transport system permease protein
MRKLILLLKTYVKIYLGVLAKKTNKKEYLSGGILLLIIGASFLFMFSSMAYTTIYEFMKLDPPMPEYSLYVLTSSNLIFMFLIVVLKGTSFKKSSDKDLLMSLPISKFIIVLSKILKEYLFDFVSLLFIMMPGYVCYYIYVPNTSWLIIFFGLIVVVLLTCTSNGIAIIMNAVISKLTKRLKNAEIVQTIISVFIVICFLIVYYIFNVSLGNSPQLVESFINIPVIKWIVNIIAYYSITDLLILSLVCLVPFAVSVAIEVHGFNKSDVNKTSSQKEVEFKQKNITMHLFKNECSRYFRSNIYVLNTIIGSILIILFAGLLIGFGKDRILSMITTFIPNADAYLSKINGLIVIMLTLVSSTVITTSASISIEGKYF